MAGLVSRLGVGGGGRRVFLAASGGGGGVCRRGVHVHVQVMGKWGHAQMRVNPVTNKLFTQQWRDFSHWTGAGLPKAQPMKVDGGSDSEDSVDKTKKGQNAQKAQKAAKGKQQDNEDHGMDVSWRKQAMALASFERALEAEFKEQEDDDWVSYLQGRFKFSDKEEHIVTPDNFKGWRDGIKMKALVKDDTFRGMCVFLGVPQAFIMEGRTKKGQSFKKEIEVVEGVGANKGKCRFQPKAYVEVAKKKSIKERFSKKKSKFEKGRAPKDLGTFLGLLWKLCAKEKFPGPNHRGVSIQGEWGSQVGSLDNFHPPANLSMGVQQVPNMKGQVDFTGVPTGVSVRLYGSRTQNEADLKFTKARYSVLADKKGNLYLKPYFFNKAKAGTWPPS